MFFVTDSQAQRHKMIRSFLAKSQASIAVILAAVDFEWTLRRAILALGTRPTKDIRVSLEKAWGLQKYKDIWNQEVNPRIEVTLVEVIPSWHELTKAFVFRGRLVHGVVGVISDEAANSSVESMLQASAALEGFAKKHEGTLYKRIVRRNPRKIKK